MTPVAQVHDLHPVKGTSQWTVEIWGQ